MQTIEEAKQYLKDNWKTGVACPCCTQTVKLYNRKLHTVMALMLIELYKLDKKQQGYYHIKNFLVTKTGTNDFSKLRYWGLVVEQTKDEDDDSKRTSGLWAITAKGRKFVEGELSVPKYQLIYNKRSYGTSGELIDIKDALGNQYSYNELMGDYKPEPKAISWL